MHMSNAVHFQKIVLFRTEAETVVNPGSLEFGRRWEESATILITFLKRVWWPNASENAFGFILWDLASMGSSMGDL